MGLLTASAVDALESALAAEIREAFDFALASPVPSKDDLDRHVYAG
jgi:TPP-dependent pyruvate/acetoin dehydrogenase alpha subunit